jgi:hypothetical protein
VYRAIFWTARISGFAEFDHAEFRLRPTVHDARVSMRIMKTKSIFLLLLIALLGISSMIAAQNQRADRSFNSSVKGDQPVTKCDDIRVTYSRQPAITEEVEMALPASQVSTLRTKMSTGGVYVNGWDRNEFSVKTCKAAPADDSNSTATLRAITTTSNANGEIVVSGPSDREWTANLIIMAPRLSRMDIETRNGPLQMRDLAGVIHLTASNGPVALNNVGGVVETTTTNGPIALKAASGDQRLTAVNGPVSVELSGNRWDGPGLQVSTKNGPLSVSLPDGYSSSIAIQTSERAPVSCQAAACSGATRTLGSPSTILLGRGEPIVRLSTSNGPLSIHAPKN